MNGAGALTVNHLLRPTRQELPADEDRDEWLATQTSSGGACLRYMMHVARQDREPQQVTGSGPKDIFMSRICNGYDAVGDSQTANRCYVYKSLSSIPAEHKCRENRFPVQHIDGYMQYSPKRKR